MTASRTLSTVLVGLCLAGAASAQTKVDVTTNITTSTTWTPNNYYNLTKQIYVMPGATLTIKAGTLVISDTNAGGSLAVAKYGKIYVQGTAEEPVIMTSAADRATWTNNDPRTGTWREKANEWGNLTIMGDAFISEDATAGNTPTPHKGNNASMEGLVADFPGDQKVLYGGGNDDDNSGSISYLSLRYGGKVVSLNNELNGLSLGGIGRGTDIHHVDIMNNVDDGVEIWGGTANLKYISVWNIGDDSFDIDQGYRGRVQFVLIVQGHSLDASQGSGVGDNCFETDGAEDSDWQPCTTTTIYNATVIGQPVDGDGATTWRDNAHVQYRNCIFMDCGELVVRFDNLDGDGAHGYGYNNTTSWVNCWTTPYTTLPSWNAGNDPKLFASLYQIQSSGYWCEITDSVFYNNTNSKAYDEATARGVFGNGTNNVKEPSSSPITKITRGTQVTKGGKAMVPVTYLDPRPANDALTSAAYASGNEFWTSANYRGAFAPGNNWLAGWTAASAYGMTDDETWCDIGLGKAGTGAEPVLSGSGPLTANSNASFNLTGAKPASVAVYILGTPRIDLPLFGGTLVPNPVLILTAVTDKNGDFNLTFPWPSTITKGTKVYGQVWVVESFSPVVWAATNALKAESN